MDQQLITDNQGLVHWQARRYIWSGIPYEDLVQEGNLGLMKAAERFDPERGAKFSTYATWWVRQHVQRAAAKAERHVSLDEHIGEDGGTRRIDRLEGGMLADMVVSTGISRRVICCVTPREEAVLVRRFGVV
tara:strand:- start:1769 stop:2164 length:396 start_codon:yes stop_codon:yes gene_type:complete